MNLECLDDFGWFIQPKFDRVGDGFIIGTAIILPSDKVYPKSLLDEIWVEPNLFGTQPST